MTSDPDISMWDAEAATFDEPADHGLLDPAVRAAWRDLLLSVLPPAPGRVADLGSGTGTLAVLLADEGYEVDGVDFSPQMVHRAVTKAGDRPGLSFVVADASDPPLPHGQYDVVLCRHVLWAMPDPLDALRTWERLLAPGGLLVLVEGFWSNGAGLRAEETVSLVQSLPRPAELRRLSDPAYWGHPIVDDRYLVVSRSVERSPGQ
jgi:ubiquinone/menaquinone biosynthesis C-methylase UbiE